MTKTKFNLEELQKVMKMSEEFYKALEENEKNQKETDDINEFATKALREKNAVSNFAKILKTVLVAVLAFYF